MTHGAASACAEEDGLTVGELAAASGLTVRTLHHWDRLALVVPSHRTTGGHRRYRDDDVARLYHVVALRQLGLSLTDISQVLNEQAPLRDTLNRQLLDTTDRLEVLHELLSRLKRSVAAVESERPTTAALLDLIADTVRAAPVAAKLGMYRPSEVTAAGVLASLLEGVTASHAQVRGLLDTLPADVLRYQEPAPKGLATGHGPHTAVSGCVGAILTHTVVFEDQYVHRVIQARPAIREESGWTTVGVDLDGYGSCNSAGLTDQLPAAFDIDALRRYTDAVFASTFEYVSTATDAELNRDIPGPGRHATTWSMKVWELLVQVAAHAFAHRGQVDVLAQLATAPPAL